MAANLETHCDNLKIAAEDKDIDIKLLVLKPSSIYVGICNRFYDNDNHGWRRFLLAPRRVYQDTQDTGGGWRTINKSLPKHRQPVLIARKGLI